MRCLTCEGTGSTSPIFKDPRIQSYYETMCLDCKGTGEELIVDRILYIIGKDKEQNSIRHVVYTNNMAEFQKHSNGKWVKYPEFILSEIELYYKLLEDRMRCCGNCNEYVYRTNTCLLGRVYRQVWACDKWKLKGE